MNILEQKLRQLIREELTRSGSRPLNEMMGMGRFESGIVDDWASGDLEQSWDPEIEDAPVPASSMDDTMAVTQLEDDELAILTLIRDDGYSSALAAYGDEADAIIQALSPHYLAKNEQTGAYFITPDGQKAIEDNTW